MFLRSVNLRRSRTKNINIILTECHLTDMILLQQNAKYAISCVRTLTIAFLHSVFPPMLFSFWDLEF
jgi:hypothetical protein